MSFYKEEEKLVLHSKPIRVTKKVYDILRKEKTKQKISMAKIVCNLIIEKYDKN